MRSISVTFRKQLQTVRFFTFRKDYLIHAETLDSVMYATRNPRKTYLTGECTRGFYYKVNWTDVLRYNFCALYNISWQILSLL